MVHPFEYCLSLFISFVERTTYNRRLLRTVMGFISLFMSHLFDSRFVRPVEGMIAEMGDVSGSSVGDGSSLVRSDVRQGDVIS